MICRGGHPCATWMAYAAGARLSVSCRKAKAELSICCLCRIKVKDAKEQRAFAVASSGGDGGVSTMLLLPAAPNCCLVPEAPDES